MKKWPKEYFVGLKTEEEREARRQQLMACQPLLNDIAGILTARLAELRRLQAAGANYDEASWAYKQADFNGSIREVEKMLNYF